MCIVPKAGEAGSGMSTAFQLTPSGRNPEGSLKAGYTLPVPAST